MSSPARSVNDAIVEAFTTKVEREVQAHEPISGSIPTMRRGAHPKHHALVNARFSVRDDVPTRLKRGLFAEPRTFDAYVRFSNSGREQNDAVPDAHGMAIKLLDVRHRSILQDETDTHDFILVDAPVFVARSPEDFAEFLMLAGTLAAAAPEAKPAIVKEIGARFKNVATLKKTIPSPLTVPYWSQVPYALGDDLAVKYKCVPREFDLTPPVGAQDQDYLRAVIEQRLSKQRPVVFDVMVQVGTADMQIDDPTLEWSEAESEPVPVATLEIPPQRIDAPAQMQLAENITFNPAHASPVHRPLGRVNASRVEVYQRMQAQRHAANGVDSRERTVPRV